MPGHALILVKNAISPHDLERRGINALTAMGFSVNVLDLGNLLSPQIQHNRSHYSSLGIPITVISSWRTLHRAWPLFQQADLAFCFIATHHMRAVDIPLFRLLGRSRTPYVLFMNNTVPGILPHEWHQGWWGRMRERLNRLRTIRPLDTLASRIAPGWVGAPQAAAVVYGGVSSVAPSQLVGPDTLRINAHTNDYDSLRTLRGQPLEDDHSAVFIDQYLPFHPDWVERPGTNRIDPDSYYTSLRRLFDRIEAELGLRVVIAAHPRANYADKPGLFGDRLVASGQTTELIRRSSLVIGHYSLALGQAVIFHKPVLLLRSASFGASLLLLDHITEAYARALGTQLENMDTPQAIPLADHTSPNEQAYAGFIHQWVKQTASPEAPLHDIVIAAMRRAGLIPDQTK